jgi:anthranilate synthase/aminodeoxychorismate synthase-like glutamine amidotransferase
MIYLIDNYDSFTYNLYHYIGIINKNVIIKRNDEITINEIINTNPSHIFISPGSGHPKDSKISLSIVNKLSGKIPILGVCLGQQAIALSFGAKIVNSKEIVHGKQSTVYHDGKNLFYGIPSKFNVVRYHSLAVDQNSLPECLVATAFTSDGTIMAIKHKYHKTFGVQFHPESLLTEYGMKIIENFLQN